MHKMLFINLAFEGNAYSDKSLHVRFVSEIAWETSLKLCLTIITT